MAQLYDVEVPTINYRLKKVDGSELGCSLVGDPVIDSVDRLLDALEARSLQLNFKRFWG
ncbi:MAG: hypothetical protein AB7I09_17810 [Planctomycetota bacterium]